MESQLRYVYAGYERAQKLYVCSLEYAANYPIGCCILNVDPLDMATIDKLYRPNFGDVNVNIDTNNYSSLAKYENIIDGVDIYCTDCIDKYNFTDTTNLSDLFEVAYGNITEDQMTYLLTLYKLKTTDLTKELKNATFYKVDSISFNEIKAQQQNANKIIKRKLSLKNIETKPALNSFQLSQNKIFSKQKYQYNSRLFFADTTTQLFGGYDNSLDLPTTGEGIYKDLIQFLLKDNGATISVTPPDNLPPIGYKTDVNISNAKKVVNFDVVDSTHYVGKLGQPDENVFRLVNGVVCYPHPSAKYIRLHVTVNSIKYLLKEFKLTEHSFLNFSFALNIDSDGDIVPFKVLDNPALTNLSTMTVTVNDTYYNSNRIQATEINNPYIFPAINSYMIGNDGSTIIKSMNTQSEPLSEGQYGQYPLVVFTNSGIYAMQQGTGEVLFQNIIQLSNLSCVGKSLTVAKGIVFATQDSIFVLFGRNVTNIADKLSAAFDSGFKNDFLNDGIMFGRDNYHNELIIANGTKQVKLINLDSFTISSVKDYSIT